MGSVGGEQLYPHEGVLWWVACHLCHQHPCLGTSPCCWEDWEGTTAPITLVDSPNEVARTATHGDA